ncbi:MAG: TolB protein [Flavobacteriales bacterium]|jgi:TolB protein
MMRSLIRTALPIIGSILGINIFTLAAQAENIGQFEYHADIGPVKHTGNIEYDTHQQRYIISASGQNMWGIRDEFHYAWNDMSGDFIVRAHVRFEGKGVDPHRKIGWNVRSSLAHGSPHINAVVHGDGLTSLQYREVQDGPTLESVLSVKAPDVIQLERRGDTYIMSAAKFGDAFHVNQISKIVLGANVKVGLSVTAHNADVLETLTVSNVRIIQPADINFRPYQDYIGSNLEIMDMNTFNRRIVYRDPNSIQAPNWTHDGKTLIYNSKGLLFNYDIKSGNISELNTGFANNNNNDHVLSWDGKDIAISHHSEEEEGRSTIYSLPLSGSDKPRKITKAGVGHSYLHGYAIDDASMIFTANRDNKYNIYSIDIKTGQETQLTNTTTLDDGSEYSSDGKHIYFNSNRTGTMQLWRMKPDGSDQTQLTSDHYNDWFPHTSPDKKSIVFISYHDDIDSGDHPFYRHVYLRQMPIGGGVPKIIAYVYGGQGTMNVPSWSPDGSKISFVSNTKIEE